MAKKWNAEETALVLREVQNPTLTNQELAKQLGRSLQSIASKKRHVSETMLNRAWTEKEDQALQETPYRSEAVLSEMLNRPKNEIHERREYLQKKRAAEAEQKAAAEKKKRLSIEVIAQLKPPVSNEECAGLPTEQEASEMAESEIQNAQKDAICAALNLLRESEAASLPAVQSFLTLMDYILKENQNAGADDRP